MKNPHGPGFGPVTPLEEAMPGPAPKPAARRRRTNKVAGARTLSLVHSAKAPPLPPLGNRRKWRPETEAWWRDIWASPMAPEFDPSDIHGLLLLAVLVDGFWRQPSKDLAAEIRLQRQCFGLSPIDRRRLQWEIDRGDEAEERVAKRRAAATKGRPTSRKDPRRLLA